jgi:hypothetical protein
MADSTIDDLPTGSLTDASLLIHSLPGQAQAYDASVASLRTFLFDAGTGTNWGDGVTQSLLSVMGDVLARLEAIETTLVPTNAILMFDGTTELAADGSTILTA